MSTVDQNIPPEQAESGDLTNAENARLVSVLKILEAGRLQADGGWRCDRVISNCRIVVKAGFRMSTLPLACSIVELLAQNQPDTVRGTMYACVSNGLVPDTSDESYGCVQRCLNNLRLKEIVPFRWVCDNIRSTEKPSSWSGLAVFADTVQDAYRRDFWASMPEYVCIVAEKDAIAGKISPVTREYDVPLHPLRGFSSTTFAAEIGETWREVDKPIIAFYIGDHDPSGRDIERSIKDRLTRFSRKPFEWLRLAVEPHQFEEFNIIPLAPKAMDTRLKGFVKKYGERCAEVEAVPANSLREMIEDAILSHIPAGEWERLQNIEKLERQSWRKMIGQLKGVV